MSYHQWYPQQTYSNRHAEVDPTQPPYPSILTTAASYPHPDSYYLPSNYPTQQLPPAHVLQYLSPPLPSHPSPGSSYPSSTSTTSRHSAPSYNGSVSPYSQPSPFTRAPQQKARAVIIGINYFNQKGELRQSCRDARNLHTYLTQVKRYRSQDIVLLTDDQNGVFGQPTRKNILDALSWISQHAEHGEKVVFYYSGHGKVAAQGKTGSKSSRSRNSEKDKGKENATNEGETIYPVDFRSFPCGMISPEEFEERLKPAQRRGAKITVILDTHAAVA